MGGCAYGAVLQPVLTVSRLPPSCQLAAAARKSTPWRWLRAACQMLEQQGPLGAGSQVTSVHRAASKGLQCCRPGVRLCLQGRQQVSAAEASVEA